MVRAVKAEAEETVGQEITINEFRRIIGVRTKDHLKAAGEMMVQAVTKEKMEQVR